MYGDVYGKTNEKDWHQNCTRHGAIDELWTFAHRELDGGAPARDAHDCLSYGIPRLFRLEFRHQLCNWALCTDAQGERSPRPQIQPATAHAKGAHCRIRCLELDLHAAHYHGNGHVRLLRADARRAQAAVLTNVHPFADYLLYRCASADIYLRTDYHQACAAEGRAGNAERSGEAYRCAVGVRQKMYIEKEVSLDTSFFSNPAIAPNRS